MATRETSRRSVRISIALGVVAAVFSSGASGQRPSSSQSSEIQRSAYTRSDQSEAFQKAERSRSVLESRPQQARTRLDYERVLDQFRAIYHGNANAPKADASVAAVADLLAEEGRVLHQGKPIQDSIGQYEFLRREYPGSRYCATALIAEGDIYARDLGQAAAARAKYQEYLRQYPHGEMAAKARLQLAATSSSQFGKNSRARTQVTTNQVTTNPATRTTLSRSSASSASLQSQTQLSSSSTSSTIGAGSRNQSARTSTRPAASAIELSPPPPPAAETSANSQQVVSVSLSESSDTNNKNASQPGVADRSVAARNSGNPAQVTGIRQWSTPYYTRVAIDLGNEVRFEAGRVPTPDRIYFDLHNTVLAQQMKGQIIAVKDDGFLKRIRAAQFSNDVVRVVLDVGPTAEYSAFMLPDPYRLIIDVHARKNPAGSGNSAPAAQMAAATSEARLRSTPGLNAVSGSNAASRPTATGVPSSLAAPDATTPTSDLANGSGQSRTRASQIYATGVSHPPDDVSTHAVAVTEVRTNAAPTGSSPGNAGAANSTPSKRPAKQSAAASINEIASVQSAPGSVRATRHPTSAPVAASITAPNEDATDRAPFSGKGLAARKASASSPSGSGTAGKPTGDPLPGSVMATTTAAAPDLGIKSNRKSKKTSAAEAFPNSQPADGGDFGEIHEAEPTAAGERSLVRALGLKIGRIVIDAGHGGHDTGTIGADGIAEKDVVLDVALRLGKLLKQRLGADVIYTRDTDTFVPLETRTAIANKAQADLFISIHANSSHDSSARGVETYFLNFTSSPDALDVAARENAVSEKSIHELQDLVKKITLKDKIEESREFASDVDRALYEGVEAGNDGMKDRGVKKAPFVVLIGANMPSILTEISFVSNPEDARELREPAYRERIAESLYRGISKYVNGLSGVRVAEVTPERQ